MKMIINCDDCMTTNGIKGQHKHILIKVSVTYHFNIILLYII